MFRSFFKIAFRGFWQHKFFTLINIMGLSIGISAAVVIFMIVHFDLSFNQFPHSRQLYRVVSNFDFDGTKGFNGGVAGPLPEATRREVTGLAGSAPLFCLFQPTVIVNDGGQSHKLKAQNDIALADAAYFKLFPYTWLAGSAATALNDPNRVVLTSDRAKAYFPSLTYNEILGRTISYDSVPVIVSGIVASLGTNTDFKFHDLISLSTIQTSEKFKKAMGVQQWQGITSSYQFFVQLAPGTTPAGIEKQMNALLKKYTPSAEVNDHFKSSFALQALSDLHFNAEYNTFEGGHTVSRNTLYGLLATGIFLLMLACINFINLSTAQGLQRAREIGVRKTMGSTRVQLIQQFMSETFLLTLISVLVAVALTPLLLRVFADFIPDGIVINFLQPALLLFLCGLTLVVTVLSGFYPAIVLSGFNAVTVIKDQASTGKGKTRTAVMRKSLIVMQFVIAQFFIIAMLMVTKQIHYALNKDLGFKKDAILLVHIPWKAKNAGTVALLADKFRSLPQVSLVSIGAEAPVTDGMQSTGLKYKNGKANVETMVELKEGDENYIDLYKIKLLAGRKLLAIDSTRSILINETCAKVLGFVNPVNATGAYVTLNDKQMLVAGVVKDFYEHSMHAPIQPLAMMIQSKRFHQGNIHVALKPQTAAGEEWNTAIESMRKDFMTAYPEGDFEYRFLDDSIAKFYTSEQHSATLLSWATALSVFISCLGLLGLAMYTTGQRKKEIGVRKVLGASVTQIVSLLSRELVLLVLLAFVLVVPAAWWAVHKWMNTFADRTEISWWIFALSGGGMLLTALCTLSFQTVRAAIMDPVKSLKSE